MLSLRPIFIASLLAVLLPGSAFGQRFNICEIPVGVDSGLVENSSNERAIIFSTVIEVPESNSLRLRFGEVHIGRGSEIVITSLEDGDVARMEGDDLVSWGNSTPYFNGDAVRVELDATPGPGYRVVIESALAQPPLDRQDLEWRCEDEFLRGDVNGDGAVDIADAVVYLSRFFLESVFRYDCEDAADADDSGRLEITDAIFLLNFLFVSGPPLPQPLGRCGEDATPDLLNLCYFPGCP